MIFDSRIDRGEPERQGAASNVVVLRSPKPKRRSTETPHCEICGSSGHTAGEGHTLCPACHEDVCAVVDDVIGECRSCARRARIQEQAEAIALAGTLLPQPVPVSDGPEATYTTVSLLDDYARSRKARGRAEATLDFISHHAATLLRLLPARASEITHATLLGYIATRRAEGAGEVVRKEVHSILRPALKLAYKSDLFGVDPAKVIPELDSLAKPRERWLSVEEAWAVVRWLAARSAAGRDHAACVAFALATGAEYAAWSRAQRSDVRDDRMGARVRGSKRRTRDRFAPSPLAAQQELVRYALDNARGVDAMFGRWAPSNANSDLKEACADLGISPCSTNDLRRSYASWLGQAGVRDELIEKAMGHKGSSVLGRHYRKLTDDDLLRLMLDDLGKEHANVGNRPTDPGTSRIRRMESNHDSGIQSPLSYP